MPTKTLILSLLSFFAVFNLPVFAVLPDMAPLALSEGWEFVASDGVKLALSQEKEPDGTPVLRLDYNFESGAGYAGIKYKWPKDAMPELPENYIFSFRLKSNLPENNLEFKLTDPGGENVWWHNRRNLKFPAQWTDFSTRKRQIEFAWGPSNAQISGLSALEFVLASVKGGKGTVWIKDISFRALKPEPKEYPVPVETRAPGVFSLDMTDEREIGGIETVWDTAPDGSPATPARAVLEAAYGEPANAEWKQAAEINSPLSKSNFVPLADFSARLLRLKTFSAAGGPGPLPASIKILPPQFADNRNLAAKTAAAEYRKGVFPKAILGAEQSNWTVLGAPRASEKILINEEGQVETAKSGPSFEPFVRLNGKLLTWADGVNDPRLLEGYLPMAEVTRRYAAEGLELVVSAFVETVSSPKTGDVPSRAWVRYRLTNTGKNTVSPELAVALRPYQTLPPWQWLNITGGAANISSVSYSAGMLNADGRKFTMSPVPSGAFASSGDMGDIMVLMSDGRLPAAGSAACPHAKASWAGTWKMTLAPGESREVLVDWPVTGDVSPLPVSALKKGFKTARTATEAWWKGRLGRIKLTLPKALQPLYDTARSQVAYILVNREGDGMQPGSRSYERSWIRDGAMMSVALLEFDQSQEAKEFADWYAPRQFASGKVPCVVDRRGPDPVIENDSHGQLIFAIANVYRYTGDKAFLKRNYSYIEKAVAYIKEIRATRMTDEYRNPAATRQEPGRAPVPVTAFYGLVPESISHEGYSAKPMHSYWDDFYTLRGLRDAADMARATGNTAQAEEWAAFAADFRATLLASIKTTMAAHGIDYIPGCVELGDFDATSAAVSLTPVGELPYLPRPLVESTFNKYWDFFTRRRDDPSYGWIDYTPYEMRVIGAMVMLGRKDRVSQMLDWFMSDRHPAGFNHWAEIVHHDRSKPAWIGDMPHTWVGSDFLRSMRTIFLYEDEAASSLHVFAGVPQSWLAYGEKIGFKDLATPRGRLSAEILPASGSVTIKLSGDLRLAEATGGIVVHLPVEKAPASCTVNGKTAAVSDGTVTIRALPAVIKLSTGTR